MPTKTTPAKPPRDLLALSRDREGWWLNAARLSPDEPRWGPWATRAEAAEVKRSFLRNALEKPWLKPGWVRNEAL